MRSKGLKIFGVIALLALVLAFVIKLNMDRLEKNAARKAYFNVIQKEFPYSVNNKKIFREAIRLGVDVNYQGEKRYAAIHVASMLGDEEALSLLIKSGAKVDLKAEFGRSALHFAKNKRIVSALVQHGADINLRDIKGATPLMIAVIQNRKDAAIALVDAGADKGLKTTAGVSANDFCVYKHKKELRVWLDEPVGGGR